MTPFRSKLPGLFVLATLLMGSAPACDDGIGLLLETFTGLQGAGLLSCVAGNDGGGCGSCEGCGDCGACGGCTSCGDCGCALTMGPVRDGLGRRQGFAGMHPNRRIERAVQARLSQSGFTFVEGIVPTIANPMMARIDLPKESEAGRNECYGTSGNDDRTPGYLTASLHHVALTPVENCTGNPQNQIGQPADGNLANTTFFDCIEFEGYVRARSCDIAGSCAPEGERVCLGFNADPIARWDSIIVTSDHRGYDLDGDPNNDIDRRKDFIPIRAQLGLWADTNARPAAFHYGGFSRLTIFDVHLPMESSLELGTAHAKAITPWNDALQLTGTESSEVHAAFQEYRSDDGDSERTIDGHPTQGDFTMNNGTLRSIAEGVIYNLPWNNMGLANESERPRVFDIRQSTWWTDTREDNGNMIVDAAVDRYVATPKCSRAEDADGNPDPSMCPSGTDYDPPSGSRHARCLIHSNVWSDCPPGFGSVINNHCYNTRYGGDTNSTDPKMAWSVACLEDPIGVDVHMNIGPAVAAITPGVEAALDFLVAATGNGETVANGYNINLAGGIENVAAGIRALGHNPCVPIEIPANSQSDCPPEREFEAMLNGTYAGRCVPRIPAVPAVGGIRGNTPPRVVPGRDGLSNYEAGVVVSEDFMNYALWKVWDSGATCLSVGTTLSSMASPSLLSLAIMSEATKFRAFFPLNLDPTTGGSPTNQDRSSVSLSLRPQTAPVVLIEERDDPCETGDTLTAIEIALNGLRIDLSLWSDERYVRIGTIDTDVRIVLGLDVGPEAASTGTCRRDIAAGALSLTVIESNLDASEDARFLPDGPMLSNEDFMASGGRPKVARGLDTIAGFVPGIVSGSVGPIAVESLVNNAISGLGGTLGLSGGLPLHITFDPDSVQGVEEGAKSFVGVYLDFDAPGPTPLVGTVDTQVTVTSRTMPSSHEGFAIAEDGFAQGESPTLEIAMSATGPSNVEYEYSYRTTYGEWSPWQRSPYAVIRGRELFVEGDQLVFARARIAGVAGSEDESPVSASFTIDVTAPMLAVYQKPNGLEVQAIDLISDRLEMRTANADGSFGEWTPMPASGVATVDAGASAVEVRDAEGNVASTSESIQGRPNTATASGCGCVVAGSSRGGSVSGFGLAVLLVVVVARRRRSRASA